jgi:hypothetical protein
MLCLEGSVDNQRSFRLGQNEDVVSVRLRAFSASIEESIRNTERTSGSITHAMMGYESPHFVAARKAMTEWTEESSKIRERMSGSITQAMMGYESPHFVAARKAMTGWTEESSKIRERMSGSITQAMMGYESPHFVAARKAMAELTKASSEIRQVMSGSISGTMTSGMLFDPSLTQKVGGSFARIDESPRKLDTPMRSLAASVQEDVPLADMSLTSSDECEERLVENRLSGRKFNSNEMAEVYDLLSEFEQNIRRFIDQKMSAAYGPDWVRKKVHKNIWQGWQDRQVTAALAGEYCGSLIDYADFGDYANIISQKDNWIEVFKQHFGRVESVKESLYRLHPVRVCTMHARVLPPDLRLVLKVEVMQLSKRIWN